MIFASAQTVSRRERQIIAPKPEPRSYRPRRVYAMPRGEEEMTFRIKQDVFDCSIYLYPDEAHARSGERAGASGFLITRPVSADDPKGGTLWAVTNRHVIEQGHWTIRLNTKDGGIDVVDTDDSQWIYHPDGSDLAIRPIALSQSHHAFSFLSAEWLLTEETRQVYDIGPGDPCYMVGRFVNHDGIVKNTPTARFGQIAQLPQEPVQIGEQKQDSFLVEIRSIGGFSGSPVFVYLDSAYYRDIGGTAPDGKIIGRGHFDTGPWLLGVEWGMVPLWDPVCDKSGIPVQAKLMVPSNTGMAAVVPSWKLRWLLLECPEVALIADAIVARGSMPSVLPTAD